MINRIKLRHYVLLSLLVLGGLGGLFYLKNDQRDPAIVRPYNAEKDFHPLVKVINDNKFWVSEHADLSPEQALILRAPSSDPGKASQVAIDVIEAEGKTAGFIAYYKKSFSQGCIWLLAVDKEFRGRGFGERLIQQAFMRLKQQKAQYVTLAVKAMNTRAIGLYKKMGFVEDSRDDERGVVMMIKKNL